MSKHSDREFLPEGWPRVIPRIVTPDAEGLVAFVKRVFDAAGEYEDERPAVLEIGDSRLMVSGSGERPPTAAFLYVYVPDVDAVYRRAVEAGARTLEDPRELPYGDRRCMLEDAWGNTWQIATRTPRG